MKKSNVVSMIKYAENDGFFRSEHCEHIVKENEQTPIHMTIQSHINNLRSIYSDRDILLAVQDLGLLNQPLRKGS